MALFNALPGAIQMKIFGLVRPPTKDLVVAMRVCRVWRHLIHSRVLFSDTIISTNHSFHRFIRNPVLRIRVSTYMVSVELRLSTAWDIRNRVRPDWVVNVQRAFNPATNSSATFDHYVSPLKQWREVEAAKMELDLRQFRMLIHMPQSFPALRHFTCTIDKTPPSDINPPPASMPVDMKIVLAIGTTLHSECHFVVRDWHDNEDRCFMTCEKQL